MLQTVCCSTAVENYVPEYKLPETYYYHLTSGYPVMAGQPGVITVQTHSVHMRSFTMGNPITKDNIPVSVIRIYFYQLNTLNV